MKFSAIMEICEILIEIVESIPEAELRFGGRYK